MAAGEVQVQWGWWAEEGEAWRRSSAEGHGVGQRAADCIWGERDSRNKPLT